MKVVVVVFVDREERNGAVLRIGKLLFLWAWDIIEKNVKLTRIGKNWQDSIRIDKNEQQSSRIEKNQQELPGIAKEC